MRKIIISVICLTALLSFCEGSYAANVGDVIGNIYTTDIIAYIDDMPIKSYNIGGRTVIQLENLRDYGFDVEWNPDERVLSVVTKDRPASVPQVEITKQTPGSVAGNVYDTDIRVFINGVDCSFIDTYNIGGITCMAIEDLGIIDDLSNGSPMYSRFAMHYTYNNDERVIKLYTLRAGDEFETQYGTAVVKNITSNYVKSPYELYDEEYTAGQGITMFEALFPEQDAAWGYYVSIDSISNDAIISAQMDNGIYSITSSDAKEIDYISTISSNGAIHNDSCILSLALPVNINGEYINDGEANCMIWLCDYEPEYNVLYMSTDFLNQYTGYKFNIH